MRVKVGIFGAGLVGLYLGGRLAANGVDVVFFGREANLKIIQKHGLQVSDLRGYSCSVSSERFVYSLDAGSMNECDLILITVKSMDTAAAADQLSKALTRSIPLVSLQNGLRNTKILRDRLPDQVIIAGMVPFNVVQNTPGHLHQGTSGAIIIGQSSDYSQQIVDILGRSGLRLGLAIDIQSVQWSKLLLNLNNSINALAGIPLKQQLAQKVYREILASAITEGIELLKRAGVSLTTVAGVPVRLVPAVLRLPNWLFRLTARSMLAIDDEARSSMWYDLERCRLTEIESLNGEILRLAAEYQLAAPVNQAIYDLIRDAENRGEGSPQLKASELDRMLFRCQEQTRV